MRDTIVIGAGLAGLMGALALAEAGRRPLVLAKGKKAILGYAPEEYDSL